MWWAEEQITMVYCELQYTEKHYLASRRGDLNHLSRPAQVIGATHSISRDQVSKGLIIPPAGFPSVFHTCQ